MEDPRWLRLITIGLVLAALVVGYLIFTGRFAINQTTVTQASPTPSVLGQDAKVSPAPSVSPSVSPIPVSAYDRIASRTQGAQTLPRTGFPVELAIVFSISAAISGWGLRKFPK